MPRPGTAALNRTETSSITQSSGAAGLCNTIAPSQHFFSLLQHKAGHPEKLLTLVFSNFLIASFRVCGWISLSAHPQKPVHGPKSCSRQYTGREMKDLDLILQLMLLALCSPMLQAAHSTAPVLSKLLQGSALALVPMQTELSNPISFLQETRTVQRPPISLSQTSFSIKEQASSRKTPALNKLLQLHCIRFLQHL